MVSLIIITSASKIFVGKVCGWYLALLKTFQGFTKITKLNQPQNFYIYSMKMVIVKECDYIIPAPNNWNVLIVQPILPESGDMLPSSQSRMLNSLLWSGPHIIIKACDLMQNSGQIWILYKSAWPKQKLTWITWTTYLVLTLMHIYKLSNTKTTGCCFYNSQ